MTAGSGGLLALADVVLLLHTALALFLSLGLAAIFIGGWRGWRWTRNRAFRVAQLIGMAVVAGESVAGVACPLTDLESALRAGAGAAGYRGGFIAHWLGRLLYYDCDERVFLALYLAALALTLWAWRKWPGKKAGPDASPPVSPAP
jgi:hypothetical protein